MSLQFGWRIFNSTKYNKNYYYNTVTNKSQWSFPTENMFEPLPHKWKLEISPLDNQYYYYNTNSGISQWKYPINCNYGLEWVGMSCYMDSVLQALFTNPNTFSNSILMKNLQDSSDILCPIQVRRQIQEELRNITKTIRGISENEEKVVNVNKLRKLFDKCPWGKSDNQKQFVNEQTADPGEFLSYLLHIFPISNSAIKETKNYATNVLNSDKVNNSDLILTSTNIDKNASVIVNIDSFMLQKIDNETDITQFLELVEDTGELELPLIPTEGIGSGQQFRRKISITKFISTPAIVFSLNRKDPITNRIIKKEIVPTKDFSVNNIKYYLNAIIVYVGNHYICFYNCEDEWYLYDDANTNNMIKKIGTYQELLNNKIVKTQGTQYFYIKKL